MSKSVDLSSKEWCDLVFEGKNKEYGAYTLRRGSYSRHNKAFWITLVLVAIAGVLGYLGVSGVFTPAETDILSEQDQQLQAFAKQAEKKPEEEKKEKVEVEQPKELPKEVLTTMKVTQLNIVKDNEVKKEDEIKSMDEQKQSKEAFGAADVKGNSDNRVTATEVKKEDLGIQEVKKPEKEEVFKAVEQMPQFPGGDAELMKWLSKNIQYPAIAQENNVQGRVIVQFVVTKTGSIGEVKIVKSVDRDLDNEAKRLVKKLPKFIPGKMNGQPVNVWYTLPVNFKLQ